jgi:hypothetical protein
LSKRLHGAGIIENEDKVCELEADLSAESTSNGSDSGGRRPGSVSQSCDNDTTTEATTSQETSLEDGENGQAFGVCENLRWDDFVGTEGLLWVDERGEDATAFLAFT